jgi:hypothetical protein
MQTGFMLPLFSLFSQVAIAAVGCVGTIENRDAAA